MSRKRAAVESLVSPISKHMGASRQVIPEVAGFNPKRCRLLTRNGSPLESGECVVYWMSRDQRVFDNHAIHFAQGVAQSRNVPLRVVFNVVPTFLEATIRQFGFMIGGLKEVEQQLKTFNIPFHLLLGDPVENVSAFASRFKAAAVVVDFSPLRVPLMWVNKVAESLDAVGSDSSASAERGIPMYQVDAHNIIPCWEASNKAEYAARTIRPKINGKLDEFLTDLPEVVANPPVAMEGVEPVDWEVVLASLRVNRSVEEVTWLRPGHTAAWETVNTFVEKKLKLFEEKRNDPNLDVSSNLSPYFHFGQIGAQKVILHVKRLRKYGGSTDSFVEEAVVRRELSDNFCFYNPATYDSLAVASEWAKETLRVHSSDVRSPLYNQEQLESANTYDDLWNAAQLQLVREGKMHGFLRMYWAKKILEWTASPEEALRIGILLNDKYSLDGRDPNGYVGVLWSIAGIHDMGWTERTIFGKIRYMNYKGCKRKFDVSAFVKRYAPAAANAARASAASGLKNV